MGFRRGSILIFLGCVLLGMGGLLTAYNLYEERAARNEVQQTLEALTFLREPPRQTAGVIAGERAMQTAAPIATAAPVSPMDMIKLQDSEAPAYAPAADLPEQTPQSFAPGTTAPAGDEPLFLPDMQQPDGQEATLPAVTGEPLPAATAQPAPVVIPGGLSDGFEIPDYMLNPRMDMPVVRNHGQDYIGVLGLELPIISEWDYARLKKAPCRYAGSAYLDNLVIAAHNYKTHFGRLKELSQGDRVIFTDADGNRFEYEVVLKETLMPRDVKEMKSGEFDLSLFTCTVGGSYRVTVRCDRVAYPQ